MIEPGRVSPDPRKLETMQAWPEILKDRKQLRGFLGMVGFYRKLIPNFNKLAHPLHQLLKDDSDMKWRPTHTPAVNDLKQSLAQATNLTIFDPENPITIKTDASEHAIGEVLEQEGRPVAFEPRKMSPRDQFLPAYESELLAIVYALTKWKSFIGNKPVVVETDHATLSRMLTQKRVTPRLGYWIDKLADFNLKVVYKPGKQNVIADAISRRPEPIGTIQEDRPRPRGTKTSGELLRWEKAYEQCPDFSTPFQACIENSKASRDMSSVHAAAQEAAGEGDHVWFDHREFFGQTTPPGSGANRAGGSPYRGV